MRDLLRRSLLALLAVSVIATGAYASTANNALRVNLGLDGFYCLDDVTASSTTTQAGATAITAECTRVTLSPANGSLILRSLTTLDAPPIVFVVNDSANTIKVYPATGENLSGTQNASLSIPSGESGIFVSVPNGNGDTQDWRSAVIP
jgi:hypothetical protein